MKKKALKSKRNRHTGVINKYKQSIIQHKESVISKGYATLTTRKSRLSVGGELEFYATDQTVRV